MDIKEMVGSGRMVKFAYYQSGHLYYTTENNFIFPVPIADFGDTRLPAEDRAMLFLKYIKLALKANAEEEEENGTQD
jgi:hypothetical protein